ncbi:NACHT domain-containing protein [Leptolyngbya sp. NK1-12]|uniref:NACHT domain-containing protein n=1 Tax=Leptolyngbya sp. NK1-12 TaxID=2547451 RepID=A0AA97ARS3_9CYAN|nr:NACHT domain-containing protein [Leptolyngbya sp. NK1-12]
MEFEIALHVADEAVFLKAGRRLLPVEVAVLQGSWRRQTYEQIANETNYSVNYLKLDVGPKLWKLLSQALGETVSKTTVQAVLERQWRWNQDTGWSNSAVQTNQKISSPAQDWSEAIDVSVFHGRTSELETLAQWIVQDRCRLITVLGMGGIGKSSLAAKIAKQLQNSFEFVIWRSLRNAPPLSTLLDDVIPFLSQQQDYKAEPHRLLHWLQSHRCLVILDNVETILQAGGQAGQYQPDYEDYGDLFRLMGESVHQSCLILTSREKPAEIAMMDGIWVQSLYLNGSQDTALALIESKGLVGTDTEKLQLCEIYNSNPLALKIVASSIQNLFDGEIQGFLQTETIVFNGIRRLLDQQFERLSELEKTVMYWLAINREYTSIAELLEDIVPPVSRSHLLEALESLSWRNLIEIAPRSYRETPLQPREDSPGKYTQQSVVMEYVTEQFIEKIKAELLTQQLDFFNRFALIKTTVQDYIRESQIRVILMPIVTALRQTFREAESESHLRQILKCCDRHPLHPEYAAGNLLNLLCQLREDIVDYDFSNLTIRQAYLQKNRLQQVSFAHSHIAQSSFIQTFAAIFSIAFSPDNQLLAVGEASGRIYVWRVIDAQLLFSLEGHTGWPCCLQFSPDGARLASACADYTVKLWDVQTGQLLTTLRGHNGWVYSLSFNPEGTILASGSSDQTIKLWDAQTGQLLNDYQAHLGTVRSVAFLPAENFINSPHHPILVSGGDDHLIKLWDIDTGHQLTALQGHQDWIHSIAVSSDGLRIASGSSDYTIKLWDVQTGALLNTLTSHTETVMSIAFSADNLTLVSGSDDWTIKRWNVETGKLLQTLQGHLNPVNSIALSPNGLLLASGSLDQTIKLWDAQTGQLLRTLQGYVLWMRSISFSPDGTVLASGSTDHSIRLWDVKTGKLLKTLHGHQGWVWILCFSPDGEILASGGNDYTIKLWDVQSGKLLKTLEVHNNWIWGVSFSSDGAILASGSCDRTLRLWNRQTGELLRTIEAHSNSITSVSFSPTHNLVASCSRDRTAKLWDAITGELVHAFPEQIHDLEAIAWSSDGLFIGIGSADHTIQLWDAQTGALRQTLKGHHNWVRCVAFHPHQPLLASGSFDGTIKLWDIAQHLASDNFEPECRTLEGHTGWVVSIAFSPDGETLASCSIDGTIRFWEIETGKCLTILTVDRPYEGLNITGITGVTEAEKATLIALGAFIKAT